MATQDNIPIEKIVKDAIEVRIKEVAEEEFELAIERIKKRKPEVVTGTVLAVEKYLSMERIGQNLHIKITCDK